MQHQRFWANLQKLNIIAVAKAIWSLSVVEVSTSTTLSDQKYPNHLGGCYNSLAPRLLPSLSLSLSLAVAAAVSMQIGQQQANASTVPIWQFDPATNELIIALPEGTTPKYSVLNQNQIAIDLPNTEIAIDATQLYPKGLVGSVGVSQFKPGRARIVMQLAPGFALVPDRTQFQKIGTANRWVLVPAIAPSSTRNTTQTQTPSATQVPQSVTVRTPNSVAPQEPVSPSAIGNQTYDRNPSQQTNQNDQIRPITLPLVRVAAGERRGVSAAPVSRPAASGQRIINFGEPLPKQ
ncbi:MAG: AMIN domain-containing protein [Oscillatoriales cyanobacterium]|nr:MAG: AMIN domain-containing protein [Oscillatoriales cyanobacterium]TAH15007.1 MAG: AMIN domain-containing protein [Oscillatoriales cyanobacterium]